MTRRARKFIGTIAILLFVCIYALLAMAMAQAQLIQNSPGFIQSLFYILIGLSWIAPIVPLIAWMERKDPSRQT